MTNIDICSKLSRQIKTKYKKNTNNFPFNLCFLISCKMYLKQFKIINNINKTNAQKILPRPCKKIYCLHMHKGLSMHMMCV